MKRIIIYLFLLAVSTLSGVSHAAIVEGLYEAEVPVADQGTGERTRAMSAALAEVIAKVSGNAEAPQLASMQGVLKSPSQLVQQFRYRRMKPTPGASSQQSRYKELAWFRFDEHAVNRVLRSNNLPVWGRTRPATLAWIAVEQDGSRFLLGGDANEDLQQMVLQDAKRSGLALIFPLLDLDDQHNLTFADVWGGFQSAISEASERYKPDAILVGRLNLDSSDQWQARWSLYENGKSQDWSGRYPQISAVMQAGVSGALGLLAKRYALVFAEDEPGVFKLAVDGVNSLKDFARLQAYLKSLEQVKKVFVTRVDPGSASFRLDIRGSSEGLRQTIALGNTLSIAPETTAMPDAQTMANNQMPGNSMMPGINNPASGGTVTASAEYRYRMRH